MRAGVNMIKRIFKILLILVVVVVTFAVGFIVTLQIFEYNPADIESLEITNNQTDTDTNYVDLNQTIKIMTFNTGYASLSETEDFVMDGGTKGRMDSAAEVEANITGISNILTTAAADIYLLQEVDVNSDRSYNTLQYQTYTDLLNFPVTLGYNYRCIFVPFPFQIGQMMGDVNSGIMTATNFFVASAARHQLPGEFSWPLKLANLKRCMTVTVLPIKDSNQNLVIINVHLSAYDEGDMRAQEMTAVKDYAMAQYTLGNYVIIGGDFNQTFPEAVVTPATSTTSPVYAYPLTPGFWEAYEMDATWVTDNGWDFGVDLDPFNPTCRLLNHPYDTTTWENNQYYVVDGFIVSPNVTIISEEIVEQDFEFSDHNPVVIEITLNN
jgi:endonuclease/exonuclease/phosphatase family metal-dependent hydrolase